MCNQIVDLNDFCDFSRNALSREKSRIIVRFHAVIYCNRIFLEMILDN